MPEIGSHPAPDSGPRRGGLEAEHQETVECASTGRTSRDPPWVEAIDVGYLDLPGAANAFLLRTAHGPVLVECGPQACLPTLERGLVERGIDPGQVAHVFVTHIHLDHAGAAGAFARRGAAIHVHPLGAAHLVDPARLIAGSRRVHGSLYDRHYGDPLPAPRERIRPVRDGERVDLGDRLFEAVETPGHAKHHHAWLVSPPIPTTGDEQPCGSQPSPAMLFTGDAAATLVPGSRFVGIPTPPPEYDLAAWLRSLQRMRSAGAGRLMLTHGGPIDAPLDHLDQVRRRLLEEDAWLRSEVMADPDDERVLARYRPWLHTRAEREGVPWSAMHRFIGDGWMRMNIAGVRRAVRMEAGGSSSSDGDLKSG